MSDYDTSTLLAVFRELPRFDTFLLNLFFPNLVTFDTAEVDFDVIDEDHSLAPFVSPLVEGKAQTNKGGMLNKMKPAYVKPLNVVDPDRVLKRRPGEAIGGAMSPAQRRDAIVVDLLDLQRQKIQKRLEWMAAQALLTGKVVVEGEDYPSQEVDFGRDAGNTIVYTGTDLWSDAASVPTDQIEDWGAVSEAPITDIVFGATAWKLFSKKQDVKDLLDTRRGSESKVELGPEGGAWYSYKGMIGSIRCWVYTAYYTDTAGAKQKYVPDNVVIAGSAAINGTRAFGAIMDDEAGYVAAEMYPDSWTQKNPSVRKVMTQSAPLMIPGRVNASMAITVA